MWYRELKKVFMDNYNWEFRRLLQFGHLKLYFFTSSHFSQIPRALARGPCLFWSPKGYPLSYATPLLTWPTGYRANLIAGAYIPWGPVPMQLAMTTCTHRFGITGWGCRPMNSCYGNILSLWAILSDLGQVMIVLITRLYIAFMPGIFRSFK